MSLRKFFPNSWFDRHEPKGPDNPLHGLNDLCTFDSIYGREPMAQKQQDKMRKVHMGNILMCRCGRWKWFPV